MKQIIRGRRSGKTTDAIKLSAETGNYILVANRSQVQMVAKMASDLNLNIPYPVSVSEILDGRADGSSLKRHGVIIDEALPVLQELLRMPINAVVISANKDVEIIEYNRKVKLPQFMASWIKDENIKSSSFDGILNDAIFNYQFHYIGDESIKDWILRNPMKLKNALDNGYEVEEEPLWEVPILSLMTSDGKQQYLSYDERQNTYFASRKWELIKQTFTDDELTKIPSQYKKYALPVEEVNNG